MVKWLCVAPDMSINRQIYDLPHAKIRPVYHNILWVYYLANKLPPEDRLLLAKISCLLDINQKESLIRSQPRIIIIANR